MFAVRSHIYEFRLIPNTFNKRSFSSANLSKEGPVASSIRQKLAEIFEPAELHVICESHMHNVPRGSERHFKVIITSEKFRDHTIVQRHRLVNKALSEELAGPVHALSITARIPEEIGGGGFVGDDIPKSPPCLGGNKL